MGALAAAYGALVLLDLLARRDVRTTQALALSARGGLDVDTGSGDVTVEAGAGRPRLEIRSRHGLFGEAKVRVERNAAGRLAVRSSCGFPSTLPSCGTSVRVVVPAGAAVRVSTGSGAVLVRGIRGGVVAQTGSGNVRLVDVAGREVLADTGSGEVTGSGVAGGRLQLKTGSGDVRVAAKGTPDDVLADTGSGEVELTLPDAVYAVSTDSGSGEERVSVRTDPGATRRVRVKTGSGDLTVRPAR